MIATAKKRSQLELQCVTKMLSPLASMGHAALDHTRRYLSFAMIRTPSTSPSHQLPSQQVLCSQCWDCLWYKSRYQQAYAAQYAPSKRAPARRGGPSPCHWCRAANGVPRLHVPRARSGMCQGKPVATRAVAAMLLQRFLTICRCARCSSALTRVSAPEEGCLLSIFARVVNSSDC